MFICIVYVICSILVVYTICVILVVYVMCDMLVVFVILAWETPGGACGSGYKTMWGSPWHSSVKTMGEAHGMKV